MLNKLASLQILDTASLGFLFECIHMFLSFYVYIPSSRSTEFHSCTTVTDKSAIFHVCQNKLAIYRIYDTRYQKDLLCSAECFKCYILCQSGAAIFVSAWFGCRGFKVKLYWSYIWVRLYYLMVIFLAKVILWQIF